MRIVGGGFVFAVWFILVSHYYEQGSYVVYGLIGVAGMAAIVFGRHFHSEGKRSQSAIKAIVYTIASILFAIIAALSWSLHPNDAGGIALFIASTTVAILASFTFISGINKIFQS